MPLSLNSEDRQIIYDTSIDYYIDLHNFAGEIVFSFALPEILFHISDTYSVDIEEGLFDNPFIQAKRKLIVAGTRNWITHKDEKGKSSINKTDVYTSMIIAIEIKRGEFDGIKKLFNKEDAIRRKQICEILQNALEVVLYRYNEKAGGTSFMTPSYLDCDRIEVAFNQNLVGKRVNLYYYRTYEFKLTRDTEEPINVEAFNEPVRNWRYFYNKSQYDLIHKRYVDSIVCAAISIEAYSWGIVREKFVEDDAVEEYASEDKDGKKSFLSATKLYKKLIDDGYILTNMSKTQLEDHVQKILNPRNDIMHGKKSVVGSWKRYAEIANEMLKELYDSFGVDVSEKCFLEKGNQNSDIEPFKEYVLKCINEKFESLRDLLNTSEKISKEYPEMELPKVYIAKALYGMQQNEKAFEVITELMKNSENQSEIAMEVWYSLSQQFGSEIERILGLVDNKDERAYALSAYVYYKRYCDEGKVSKEYLKKALENVEASYNFDPKYLTNLYLKYYILNELNPAESIKISRQIMDTYNVDYGHPLICAKYAITIGDIEDAKKCFGVFLDRFEKFHYIGTELDLFRLSYTIENTTEIADSIIHELSNNGVTENIINDFENRLADSRVRPLQSYYSKYRIFRYGRGGMPRGNIIYVNPLEIVQGYHFVER